MPNWNSNHLTIEATPEQLVQDGWLIKVQEEDKAVTDYRFNLHKLYPEKYPEPYKKIYITHNKDGKLIEDKFGKARPIETNNFDELWDYNWFVENVGCKWDFIMESTPVDVNGNFFAGFETPRSPPTELLERFIHLSKIDLECEYEEPGMGFEGTINGTNGEYTDYQRDYQESCEDCGEKSSDVVFRERHDCYQCDECYKEACSNN